MSIKIQAADEIEHDQGTPLPSEEYVPKVMPPVLGGFDMFSISILIVFFITNVPFAIVGGVSTFTYWIVAALLFFVPCAIVTAQLGVMLPHEGSLYNWTHRAFGGYWSFFVALCAWFPGVLFIVMGASTLVTFLQGLDRGWLTQPWEQWLVVLGVILLSTLIALRSVRTVMLISRVVVGLIAVAVFIITISALVWLFTGHRSATSFGPLSAWSINPTNLFVFGVVVQAYLGLAVPLNMGAEIQGGYAETRERIIKGHILWGVLFIFASYIVVTFALLITQGSDAVATMGNFALIRTVDITLGKVVGNITVICILAFFALVPVTYNYSFARLLLTAAVDRRLPSALGRLNKRRVPANAILAQSALAAFLATIIFIAIPYGVHLGEAIDLATQVRTVSQASATLIWTISTLFIFLSLARFLGRPVQSVPQKLILPKPALWACIIVGSIASIAAMAAILFYSWTSLIPNTNWSLVVGGLTVLLLVILGVSSMITASEASWQTLTEDEQQPLSF